MYFEMARDVVFYYLVGAYVYAFFKTTVLHKFRYESVAWIDTAFYAISGFIITPIVFTLLIKYLIAGG